MEFVKALQEAAAAYGVELNREQIAQFNSYYELLVEWNEKINLTAITEPKEVAVKHMVDSLSCYEEKYFPRGAKLIDIGTGAGFPGLPLKILRPDLELTLLDSLNKRVKFLSEVVKTLGLSGVELIHGRSEEVARHKNYREQFDIATARAVARLPIIAEYCLPFVKQGGYFISLKGRQFEEEMAEAQRALKLLGGTIVEVNEVKLPELDDKRAVIYVAKKSPTPKVYPRKPGTPERSPL